MCGGPAAGDRYGTGDRRPATGDGGPGTGDRGPATGDRRRGTGDRRAPCASLLVNVFLCCAHRSSPVIGLPSPVIGLPSPVSRLRSSVSSLPSPVIGLQSPVGTGDRGRGTGDRRAPFDSLLVNVFLFCAHRSSPVIGLQSRISSHRSLVSRLRSSVGGLPSPVLGLLSPVSGHPSPVSGRRSPVSRLRSSVSSLRSPVPGHSVVLLQIHPAIKLRDLISVAVEHQSVSKAEFADSPLARLTPSRMIYLRIDVRVETVFRWTRYVPRCRRLIFSHANLHN